MSRASSTPETISTRHPVAERTHSRNAWELRASRSALVATTRTLSVTICCVVAVKTAQNLHGLGHGLWSQKSGAEHSFTKTGDFAILVQGTQRPACSRAIFRRTELDPMSTAANVGMGSPTVYMQEEPDFKKFLAESEFRLPRRFASRSRCLSWRIFEGSAIAKHWVERHGIRSWPP